MFKKTRLRIVFAIMTGVMLFFVMALLIIYISSNNDIRRRDIKMLDMYISRYDPERIPGKEPPPGSEEYKPSDNPAESKSYKASEFYSVSFNDSNEVIAIDRGSGREFTDSELTEMAAKVLKSGKESGDTDDLVYKTAKTDEYSLVVFLDNIVMMDSSRLVLRNTFIIGGIFTAVAFFISVVMARAIIRPLEESDEKQRQFISDAGHELKTPLAVMGTNIDLLKRDIGDNKWLDNIKFENDKLASLVEELLFLIRVEKADIPRERIDLSNIVTGQVLVFESVAFEKGIRIESDIADGIMVEGEEGRLNRLVEILLDNALSHISGGDVIRVVLEDKNGVAKLSAINNAEEIPLEIQKRLFERLYRTDDSRAGEGDHYGLGLAIAKEIVKLFGGEIGCEFKNGQACFSVRFKRV